MQIRDLMKSCSENVKEFLSREREIEKEMRERQSELREREQEMERQMRETERKLCAAHAKEMKQREAQWK